ncbi:FAD-binding oxidoreductase [Methylobacterium oryzae CBMB20]
MLFPLSYASRGSARIGGGVGTNAGGIAVLAYGNARDLVLGLEVVLADGRVWNGLRALRKDNAGYDLKQLFIGSEGTLGIVTAAVLKLFPRPRSTSVAFVALDSAKAALDLFVFLRTRMDRDLTAFEYLPPFALEIVLRHVPGTVRPLGGAHGAYALIEVASRPAGRRHAGRAGSRPRAGAGGRADRRRHDRDQRGPERRAVAPARGRSGGADPRRRVDQARRVGAPLPPARVPGAGGRRLPRRDAGPAALRLRPFRRRQHPFQPVAATRHAGGGFPGRLGPVQPDRSRPRARAGGSIAAEHGVGLIKREELARYGDPVGLDLMRRLKAALDPEDLLNPGKVIVRTDGGAPTD